MSRNSKIKSFIFGGNAEAQTPQELERKRAMIEAMSPNFGRAQTVGEGVGHALTGLAMGIRSRQANKAEAAGRANGAKAYSDIMERAFPQPTTPETPSDIPTSNVSAQPQAKQKVADALQKKSEPKPVEVASLDPNQVSAPTGKGLAALDRGGNLKYSKDWQRKGQDDKIANIVAGAGQEMGRDIAVTSGHRPLAYNRSIGSGDGSKHVTGEAMDISMAGMSDAERQRLVQEMTQRGAGRMITYDSMPDTLHVDTGKRDSEFQPRFMHNKSASNMGSAPDWYKESAARGGVLLPDGSAAPIPAPSLNRGNMGDPNGAIQPAQTPQQAIAQNFDDGIDPRQREILAKTLQAEAGNQGLQGMLDVGSVINNRVNSGRYGEGLEGVIMKDGQFSAWNGVTGYNNGVGGLDMENMRVSEDAYAAADAILSGQFNDETNGATHYYNNSLVNPAWGQRRAGGEWQQRGAHLFGNADGKSPALQNMPSKIQNPEQIDPRKMLENGPVQVASLDPNSAAGLYDKQPMPMGYAQAGIPTPAPTLDRGPTPPANIPAPAQTLQRPAFGGSGGMDAQAPQPMQQQAPAQVSQNNQIGIRELIEASQNPWLSDGQRGTIQMLLEREMQQADPLRQLEIKKMEQELQTGGPNYMSPADKLAREKFEYERNKPDLATSSKEYEYYKLEMDRLGQPALGPLEYRRALKQAGANNTNVTVNGPAPIPEYSKLPAGYVYKRDEAGNVLIDQNGIPMAAPIAGGPADIEAQRIAETKRVAQESKSRSGNVVLEDIDRALAGLDEGVLPTAGPIGGALSNVAGTQAYNVAALIQTIKANSGFDRLQAMRDSSPTGGALGAINQSEMELLQSAMGNLTQSQDAEQLKFNLKRVRDIYHGIIHGKQAPQGSVNLKDKYGLE